MCFIPRKSPQIKYTEEESRWGLSQERIRYLIREYTSASFKSTIGASENTYIIFIDSEYDLDWILKNPSQNEAGYVNDEQNERLEKIISRIAEAETIPTTQQCESIRIQYKKMLGEALCCAFEGAYEQADSNIKLAIAYISARNVEQYRFRTLLACLITLLIFLVFSFYFFHKSKPANMLYIPFTEWKEYGNNLSAIYLLYIAFISGIIGTSISIIQKTSRENISSESLVCLQYFEPVLRLIIGGISSCILTFLIQSGLIFAPIREQIGIIFCTIIFGLAAGLADRAIPNMLKRKLESEVSNES